MAIIKVLKDKLENILDPFIPRYEALRVHSTEPVIIGKWIDNRPIYRKILYIPNSDKFHGNYNIDSGVKNIGYLDMRGGMSALSSDSWYPITQYFSPEVNSRMGMSIKKLATS